MNNLLSIGVLPVVLTLSCFLLGQKLQKKLGSALINPIIIAVILVLLFLKCTGISPAAYQADLRVLSWLLTPATICLALPMYEQFQLLKKHLGAIAAGVAAGTAASLAVVFGFAWGHHCRDHFYRHFRQHPWPGFLPDLPHYRPGSPGCGLRHRRPRHRHRQGQ